MSLKAGRYVGTIASGSGLYESMNGTLGFQVFINTEDGATEYTIWLTEKNAERAKKDFATLGVPASALADEASIAKIGAQIEGHEVSLEAAEEEFQGKVRVKVRWISPKKDPGVGSMEQRAASLFGGKASKQRELDDDRDVPF